ncbi:helix-turn-helix domain-containing protein [Bacillus sp. OTU2372]|uniref:helix-turn-helix domain-containing protein n=1 Tax=Bacillus sp. OTU2372 TaxID=3043858 RepID=UPI00313B4611
MSELNPKDYPLTLRVEDLQKILRLSKASTYDLTKQKGFPSIRVGRRILIPRDAFFKWYGVDIYEGKVNE